MSDTQNVKQLSRQTVDFFNTKIMCGVVAFFSLLNWASKERTIKWHSVTVIGNVAESQRHYHIFK